MDLLFILLLVGAGIAGFMYGQRRNGTIFVEGEFKKGAKARILKFLREKESITKNQAEELLGVPSSTATLYLNELEKKGHIAQMGDIARGKYYISVN